MLLIGDPSVIVVKSPMSTDIPDLGIAGKGAQKGVLLEPQNSLK